jgi:hypothetical protein
MQTIHDLLMSMTAMLFAIAGMVAIYDMWCEVVSRRSTARGIQPKTQTQSRWKVSLALALVAWIPLLVALAMVIFTSGRVGIRVGEMHATNVQNVARVQAFATQPVHVTGGHVRHR